MKRKIEKMIHTKMLIYAVLTCLVFCFFVSACSTQEKQEETETKISVAVYTVEPMDIDAYSRFSAKATPYREQLVIPKVSGEIEELAVDIGSVVKEGDLLFKIDDTDIALSAKQAEAGYLSAKSNYQKATGATSRQQVLSLETSVNSAQINADNAYSALQRTQALFDMGAASQQELEQVQASYDLAMIQLNSAKENLSLTQNQILGENEQAALAGLKQSEAAYELAQNQLENAVVTSDIDGVVGMNKVSVGSMVGPSSPVMSINDISKIILEVSVSDRIINKLTAQETRVAATIASLPDQEFSGVVEAVSPVADKTTLLYLLKIEIDNQDEVIKPGMIASVKIVTDTAQNALCVPVNCVFEENGKHYIYLAGEDNMAKRAEVEIGLENDDFIQILTGVAAGDKVVYKGQNLLSDGTGIEIVE